MGLIFGTGYIAEKTRANLHVAVIDSSGYFTKALLDKNNAIDNSSTLTLVENKPGEKEFNYDSAGFDAYLIIPSLDWKKGDSAVNLRAKKSYGPGATAFVETKLNRMWDEIKNDSLKIDTNQQRILISSRLGLHFTNITDPRANAKYANSIGFACGFLIYFIILIYGSQVMMGVMEEKTNRIAEIIVSSVKPFQMMLGKIVGIALVALTQFLLWIAFVFIIYNVTKVSGSAGGVNSLIGSVQQVFTSINVPMILFCFAFYFLAGFFFYSSIYGAIGSAVNEDVREAQSLSFPITMLIIISIFMMTTAINDPTGPVAFGKYHSFQLSYCDDGTNSLRRSGYSSLVAVGSVYGATYWRIYFYNLVCRKSLSNRNPDVWKKPSWKELIKWAFRKS